VVVGDFSFLGGLGGLTGKNVGSFGKVRAVPVIARTNNGKNKQRLMGGKVLAAWIVQTVPGSFAALRMTAKTNNSKNINSSRMP